MGSHTSDGKAGAFNMSTAIFQSFCADTVVNSQFYTDLRNLQISHDLISGGIEHLVIRVAQHVIPFFFIKSIQNGINRVLCVVFPGFRPDLRKVFRFHGLNDLGIFTNQLLVAVIVPQVTDCGVKQDAGSDQKNEN